MRLRFHDKPSDAGPPDRPEVHGARLRALNLRNRALFAPLVAVTRQPTTDAPGRVTTLRQLNARNENFWRKV